MLPSWMKRLFCHQHFAKRMFSNVQQKTTILDCCEKHEPVITFKEKSFNFFQKSEKYQELCVPPNKLLNLPIEENNNWLTNGDLSVPKTVKIFNELVQDSASKLEKLQENNIVNILNGCTGREALLLANTLFQIVGEKLKKGLFYQKLVSKANHWIQSCSSHQELVLWAFLCSLEKSKQSNACLRSIYEYFKTDTDNSFRSLSTFEMSILCNTWFANNIIISSKPMLRVIDQHLRKEIDLYQGVISQEALALLKVLRKACFGTDQLFESLTSSLSCPLARNLNLAQASHA